MNKSEFRAKHSELIGYYQYIEMRLKGICAVILADESIMDEALHIGVDSFLAKPLFAPVTRTVWPFSEMLQFSFSHRFVLSERLIYILALPFGHTAHGLFLFIDRMPKRNP